MTRRWRRWATLAGLLALVDLSTESRVNSMPASLTLYYEPTRALGSLWHQALRHRLAHLAQLKSLRSLEISGQRLTDAGMVYLELLTNLETLVITDGPITNDGLSHCRGLLSLTKLDLGRTRVESLEPVKHLTMIQTLSLPDTPIDDVGVAPIGGFRSLNELILSRTRVGDAGLARLADLAKLGVLKLDGTRISDTSLVQVARLAELRRTEFGRDGGDRCWCGPSCRLDD